MHAKSKTPVFLLGALALALLPASVSSAKDAPGTVTYENFGRAETDMQIARVLEMSGGTNQWSHFREPTPLDQQNVIRMNRDTLYSWVILDISEGATITLPEAGDRYLSLMVLNNEGYVNRVFHGAGEHVLTIEEFDTPWVVVLVRTLVDSADPADVAKVNALQDQMKVEAGSSQPFEMTSWDPVSYREVYDSLIALGRLVPDSDGMFGSKSETDPVRFRIGSAIGWAGLPGYEAEYMNVEPGLPVGEYQVTTKDVPVDGFWSISVYNKAGFFEKNSLDAYSVNNVTGEKNADGSFTVHFGGCADGRSNCLPIAEGWNYVVRLYRPREEVRNGSWKFPGVQPVPKG